MHNEEDEPLHWSLPNLLASLVWQLHRLIPRPPILTDSAVGFVKKLDASLAIKKAFTREQLRHEYGFDDDR